MTTMQELYGSKVDDGEHEACPKCGWCLVCDACICDYLEKNPEMEALRFPYQEEETK